MDDKLFMKEQGERIKSRREELGLSQLELAEKVGYHGKSTICMIEQGKRAARRSLIEKLAEALQTTPGYLMGWERLGLMEKLSNVVNGLSEENIKSLLQIARILEGSQQSEED